MMNNSILSVIVPIYNVEKYLSKCIDSIINQRYKQLEIILVDDGSTDDSGKIADKYGSIDKRIVVLHKKNGGLSSARNFGIQKMTGDFFTFVDSDDWLDEEMYQLMMEAASTYNADIVSTNARVNKTRLITKSILEKYLLYGDVSCCNKIFKATPNRKNLLFDSGNVAVDILGCFNYFKSCEKWCVIKGAFYNYRQDNISYGRSGFSFRDMNAVKMTSMVAKECKHISKKAYSLSNNHVLHSQFDMLNKYAIYGAKSENDLQIFNKNKPIWIVSIRRNFFKIIFTSYFSFKEKLQMITVSFFPCLFFKTKSKWNIKTNTSSIKL